VFKNLFHGRGRRSRFLLGFDVSSQLFQKQIILALGLLAGRDGSVSQWAAAK
jgi:hypothetical protein